MRIKVMAYDADQENYLVLLGDEQYPHVVNVTRAVGHDCELLYCMGSTLVDIHATRRYELWLNDIWHACCDYYQAHVEPG